MSDADLERSYKAYAKALPGQIRRSLAGWNKRNGPFWEEVTIKGRIHRYHVITAIDIAIFDESPTVTPDTV